MRLADQQLRGPVFRIGTGGRASVVVLVVGLVVVGAVVGGCADQDGASGGQARAVLRPRGFGHVE